MLFKSVRSKLILFSTVIFVFTILVISFFSSYYFAREYNNVLNEQGLAVEADLKNSLEKAVKTAGSLSALNGFDTQCRELVDRYEHLVYALVLSADGRIVFQNSPGFAFSRIEDIQFLEALAKKESVVIRSQYGISKFRNVIEPVFDHEGIYMASVCVGFPLNLTTGKVFEMILANSILSLLVIASGSFLFILFITHWVTKPIQNLINQVQFFKFREDNKEGPITNRLPFSRDEIGQLSIAFEQLTDRLKESDDKIHLYTQSLEDTVRQRTASLTEMNQKLQADISYRERTEEALKQSEERYRSLVENTLDAYFIVQYPDGDFIFVNSRFCELMGTSQSELRFLRFWHFFHRDDLAELKSRFQTLLNEREFLWGRKVYNAIKQNSNVIKVEVSASRVMYEEKVVIQGVLRDVTEQLILQQQLQQAQKMEAIGTLAGGLAHDFNNLLQVIQGYGELLLIEYTPKKAQHVEIRKIIEATKRGGELTQQLLTFSRKVSSRVQPVNLNYEVMEFEKLLNRVIPKMINIKLTLSDNLKTISADPVQIEQTLMNLCLNAKDAMPEGGTLTIVTDNVSLNEEFCRVHTHFKAGDYILLSVSDTGSGIDEETMKHIFEPFFTTKEQGQGSGLGLSMVYGIVKNVEGHIICSSQRDLGTTFNLYFPAIHELAKKSRKKAEYSEQGSGLILVIDDEEHIRDLLKNLLKHFGYQVLTAQNALEGISIYKESIDNPIDLVILDLVMPGMDGKECLVNLRKLDSKVRVLISSGYSPDGYEKIIHSANVMGFIRKPYRTTDLLKTIKEVLSDRH